MSGDAAPLAVAGTSVAVDAWTGTDAVVGEFAPSLTGWAVGSPGLEQPSLVPSPPDPAKWQDERVGWGVILPENPDVPASAQGTADDAPEPIRELVAARKGKVLRYRPGTKFSSWVLRDVVGGGDLLTSASPPGNGPRQLPMYLLICAPPSQIPWSVQYGLNCVRNVGRLDLEGDGLANYVGALLDGWSGSAASYAAPVVWAVDHGGGDITTLMRNTVATPLHARFTADADMPGARLLDGAAGEATGEALADALSSQAPALVVTTCHGMTGPLDDVPRMAADLGGLVDQDHLLVRPEDLLAGWQPDGAVWFAQACCSAGADSPSAYSGLFAGTVGEVLSGVAQVGATTSPLPRALLGAAKPLRAFVGRVEPTFNWTLAFPPNRQVLTSDLESAIYERIGGGLPVGLALNPFYRPIGSLLIGHTRAVSAFNLAETSAASSSALDLALYSKVTAFDRAGTVILGDPTVALPLPR